MPYRDMSVYLNRRLTYALLLALWLAGAVLRFYGIGHKSLWLDEIYSASNVMKSVDCTKLPKGTILPPQPIFPDGSQLRGFDEIWSGRRWEPHPPLYYLLLKIWVTAFGTGDRALRALSAVGSLLIVGLVFVLGRTLGGPAAGLLAALLVATSPIQIYYGQEARNYATLSVLLLIGFYCLCSMSQSTRRVYWIGYALSMSASLYMHYFACWIVLAQAVYVLLQRDPAFLRRWLLAGLVAGLLYLPWLPQLYAQYTSLAEVTQDWLLVNRSFGLRFLNAVAVPVRLLSSNDLFVLRPVTHVNLKFLFQALALGCCLFVVKNRYRRAFGLLACWIFVPLGAFLALDTLGGSDMLKFTRFTFVLTPALYLMLALTLISLDRRICGVLLIGILAVSLHIAYRYYHEPYKVSDWRAAAAFIQNRTSPGDLIVIYKPQPQSIMSPVWLMALGRYLSFGEHAVLLAESAPLHAETLAEVLRYGRVAVVAAGKAPFPPWMLDRWILRETSLFANLGTIGLFTRTAPARSSP